MCLLEKTNKKQVALQSKYAIIDVTESQILRIINGALRSAIVAHGNITTKLVGSASKRVYGVIKPFLKG